MSLVTLTFDNGPSVKTTPQVLDVLKERNLTAYFCLVGLQLEAGQAQLDIAKDTLARGHHLVNHSFTHGVALGDDISDVHASHEVTDMHDLLEEKLGDWGIRWFRPFGRGGELGKHIFSVPAVQQLQALEYSVLLWNSVPRDWEDIDGWLETALADIDNQDHTVVVLHDLNTGAMKHLPRFLDTLLERGDTITTELPAACTPIIGGERQWSKSDFAELVQSERQSHENVTNP